MIFFDYEKSYEQKFNKPPKLVKKVEDSAYYEQMKKLALKQKQINSSINSGKSLEEHKESKPPMPTKRNFMFIQQISKEKMKNRSMKKAIRKRMIKTPPKDLKFRELVSTMPKRKMKTKIFSMSEFSKVSLITVMCLSIGNWLLISKETSWLKIPMSNFQILLVWMMRKDFWKKQYLCLWSIHICSLEFSNHGEEFFCSALLVLVRQCWLNQLPHNAKQLSSTFQHLQLCPSGEVKVKNWLEFFSSWLGSINPALFLSMKSIVSWARGVHQALSIKAVEGWKLNCLSKWMVLSKKKKMFSFWLQVIFHGILILLC